MNGILNFLKPPGMTSHDAVAVVRRVLWTKKVGHTGTLDPQAAGVLPICVGQATRIVELLQEDRKTYRAELTLGLTTDTQDRWGTVLAEHPVSVSEAQLVEALKRFTGDILQVPPMFSALKVDGQKLCDLARKGITVEREARPQTIHGIRLIRFDGQKAMLDVICSKGTYIRTLCHDIGIYLGCGGVMSFLLRTGTGAFDIRSSITLEELKACTSPEEAGKWLVRIDEAFAGIPRLDLKEEWITMIRNGVAANFARFLKSGYPEDTMVLLYAGGQFAAIAKYTRDAHSLMVIRHFL